MWCLVAFDAAHVVHHLSDDEVPFAHDVGSHAWWDGVLFHTGTIAEAVFVVRMPARPLIASLEIDRPMCVDGIPLLVPDSRAPPSV